RSPVGPHVPNIDLKWYIRGEACIMQSAPAWRRGGTGSGQSQVLETRFGFWAAVVIAPAPGRASLQMLLDDLPFREVRAKFPPPHHCAFRISAQARATSSLASHHYGFPSDKVR